MLQLKHLLGKIFPITPGVISIGRSRSSDISLFDSSVSRFHAVISFEPDDGLAVVTDLGSLNGTHLNGQPIAAPAVLEPGQVLRIGSSLFDVERRR